MINEELLNDLYYVKHNYDSIINLYKKAKLIQPTIKKELVKEWLDKQQSKQMNDDKIKKKEFLPIYSESPYAFQIDLTFFPRYTKQNKGYYVLFTAINVNTRYAYAYFSKDKNMDTILQMLKEMEKKTIINSITADEGTEFKNKEFKRYCDENDIQLYFAKGDSHKLGIINRFHRTLKDKLTKYFSANDTVIWIGVMDKIIDNYNHTINRGIGIEPYKVNGMIENVLIQKAKEKTENIEQEIINVGDLCRVRLVKSAFSDKLQSKWSNAIYKVIKVKIASVIVEDDKHKEYKIKKYDIKIIKDVEQPKQLVQRERVNKEHRDNRRNKKAGVEEVNIVEGRRVRKKVDVLDL
jgi:hypothetical protein